jgi:hypothetical protein
MVTNVDVDTAVVATANVALVLPAATVTDEGTVATDVLLLAKDIVAPPLGAALLNMTVPWELFPPVTLVGFKPKELSNGGMTVRVAVWLVPL